MKKTTLEIILFIIALIFLLFILKAENECNNKGGVLVRQTFTYTCYRGE